MWCFNVTCPTHVKQSGAITAHKLSHIINSLLYMLWRQVESTFIWRISQCLSVVWNYLSFDCKLTSAAQTWSALNNMALDWHLFIDTVVIANILPAKQRSRLMTWNMKPRMFCYAVLHGWSSYPMDWFLVLMWHWHHCLLTT